VKVLLQRVSQASVSVGQAEVDAIGNGLALFVGITSSDGDGELRAMTDKVANLRIFEDRDGRMNLSALDLQSQGLPVGVLVISQFTLYGDVRKGRRPSFTGAAAPGQAEPMIEQFATCLVELGLSVEQGVFGAHMMVSLTNDGPVTIWIDSNDLRQPQRRDASSAP